MNTIETLQMIEAVEDALEATKYENGFRKTRRFFEALSERGLYIEGTVLPKPAPVEKPFVVVPTPPSEPDDAA